MEYLLALDFTQLSSYGNPEKFPAMKDKETNRQYDSIFLSCDLRDGSAPRSADLIPLMSRSVIYNTP